MLTLVASAGASPSPQSMTEPEKGLPKPTRVRELPDSLPGATMHLRVVVPCLVALLAACSGPAPVVCTPSDEVCDDADNDCDGEVDEGCPVCANDCTAQETQCRYGSERTCQGKAGCLSWTDWTPCASGFCGDDQACGACTNDCPSANAIRCASGRVEKCFADSKGCLSWGVVETCATGACADATRCAQCTPGCPTAGQTSCAAGKVRTCAPDSQNCLAWGPETACVNGACLNASACAACANDCPSASATSCASGKQRTCTADANGCLRWSAETACPSGACASATACSQCTHACPVLGAASCESGSLRRCVADANGCRAWSPPTACPTGSCADASSCAGCTNRCPAGGQVECSAGKQRTCQADAAGCLDWSAWTGCADGFCASTTACGACLHACAPDSAECASGQLRLCGADANGCRTWGTATACPSGFCVSATACGTCNHGCATLGAVECTGGQQRTCVADANGCRSWSAATVCPGGFCSNATSCGTCTHACASVGATDCASGQLKTCQTDANGCRSWGAASACPSGFCASAIACGTCNHGCPTAGEVACAAGKLRTCTADAKGCRSWVETACPLSQCASAMACATVPVISEIRYVSDKLAGSSVDHLSFVELHGVPGTSLSGMSLVGVNGSGGTAYATIDLTGSIASDGYYLVAYPAYPATPLSTAADQLSASVDFQNGPDSVQLRKGTTVLDAVGYGTFSASQVFAGEGSAAAATSQSQSLSRDANHTDTNNNAADFKAGVPTPRATCLNDCPAAGATQCSGGQLQTCRADVDADSCLEWAPAVACPAGQTCSAGACTSTSSGNDACAGAQALVFSGDTAAVVGNTSTAFDDAQASCTTGGKDLVYSFTLTSPRSVTATATSSAYSGGLAVYLRRSCAAAADELGCRAQTWSWTNDPVSVSVKANHLPAGTYFVWVDGTAAGEAGAFRLEVTLGAAATLPANDTCAGAQALQFVSDKATVNASTANALNDSRGRCGGSLGPDVVYSFTLTAPRALQASVTSSEFGPVLRLTKDCQTPEKELVCKATVYSWPSSAYVSLTYTYLPAGTYYLWVDGTADLQAPWGGAFRLEATLSAAVTPPVNDTCAGAQAMTFVGDKATATGTTLGALPDWPNVAKDVVYTFTHTGPHAVRAKLAYDTDATLCLYRACNDSGSLVACSPGSSSNDTEELFVPNLPGGTYFLWVFEDTLANYPFNLEVTLATAYGKPANDSCTAPVRLSVSEYTADDARCRVGGTTLLATRDHSTCSAQGSWPEVVYYFDATRTWSHWVSVQTGGADVDLWASKGTCGGTCEFYENSSGGGGETFTIHATAGERYYLYVGGPLPADFSILVSAHLP